MQFYKQVQIFPVQYHLQKKNKIINALFIEKCPVTEDKNNWKLFLIYFLKRSKDKLIDDNFDFKNL